VAKKRTKDSGSVDTSAASELRHSPFAALLGGPAEAQPSEEAEEAARSHSERGSRASPEGAGPASTTPCFGAKVVVRRETKGRGGKTVTRVSGVAADHLDDLAGRMKRALGCGAKVEPPDVLLLGDLVDRAAAWLEAEGAPRVVRGN